MVLYLLVIVVELKDHSAVTNIQRIPTSNGSDKALVSTVISPLRV